MVGGCCLKKNGDLAEKTHVIERERYDMVIKDFDFEGQNIVYNIWIDEPFTISTVKIKIESDLLCAGLKSGTVCHLQRQLYIVLTETCIFFPNDGHSDEENV